MPGRAAFSPGATSASPSPGAPFLQPFASRLLTTPPQSRRTLSLPSRPPASSRARPPRRHPHASRRSLALSPPALRRPRKPSHALTHAMFLSPGRSWRQGKGAPLLVRITLPAQCYLLLRDTEHIFCAKNALKGNREVSPTTKTRSVEYIN